MHIKITENIPCLDRPSGLSTGYLFTVGQMKFGTAEVSGNTSGIASVDLGTKTIVTDDDLSSLLLGPGQSIYVDGDEFTIVSVTGTSIAVSEDVSGINDTMQVVHKYLQTYGNIPVAVWESEEFANRNMRKRGMIQLDTSHAVSIPNEIRFPVSPQDAENGVSTASIYAAIKAVLIADRGYTDGGLEIVSNT